MNALIYRAERHVVLASSFLFFLFSLTLTITAQSNGNPRPLGDFLNPDGSIIGVANGSLDPSGYRLECAPDGSPRFVSSDQLAPSASCGDLWDVRFANSGFNGSVLAVLKNGSDIYVSGSFTSAPGTGANRVAKWDGTTWSNLGNGFDADVFALAISGTGTLYAGGSFQRICNNPQCSATTFGFQRIAAWNGAAWTAVGNGVNGDVYSLAVATDGKLIAGGPFTAVCNDASCSTTTPGFNRIAQWDGAVWSSLGNGFNSNVNALAFSPGGSLFVGGTFTQICANTACSSGTTGFNRLAQWNGTTWSPVGNGFNNGVNALRFSSSGELFIGGEFNRGCLDAACATTATGFNRIAKWDGATLTGVGLGVNGIVNALDFNAAGELLIGGNFASACTNAACTTATTGFNDIARFDGTNWNPFAKGLNGDLRGLAALADGSIMAFGNLNRACLNASCTSSSPGFENSAFWNLTTWQPLGGGSNAPNRPVTAVLAHGGDVYVAGDFFHAGGGISNKVAKWNGVRWSAIGNGFSGDVLALAIAPDGSLYAGGGFSDACGGSQCSPSLGGYNRVARFDGTAWQKVGNGVNNQVNALAVSAAGTLYVGGNFSAICSNASCSTTTTGFNRIAAWDGSNWTSPGNGLASTFFGVGSLAFSPSGELYVAGQFSGFCNNSACSSSTPGANNIAVWNGTSWAPLGFGLDGQVRSIAFSQTGDLFLGGLFSRRCDNVSCSVATNGFNKVARWDGSAFSALGNGLNDHVYSVSIDSADNVFFGGFFTASCGSALCGSVTTGFNRVAKWNGAAWSALGSGMNDRVFALAVDSNDDLYVGGQFSTAGCRVSNNFARYYREQFTGAVSTDWANPANWNGGAIPTPTDSVTLNTNADISTADVALTDLRVDEAATLTVASGRTLTVTRNLVLQGTISGGGTLIVSNCDQKALVSFANSGYIRSTLVRCVNNSGAFDFPVGTASGFAPLSFANIIGTGNISVTPNQGTYSLPATGLPSNRLARWWNIENAGVTQADITLNYPAADVVGNESIYKVFRIAAGAATQRTTSIDTALHRATVAGVSQFSDWTVGEQVITAADASLGGRVISNGFGLRNAIVSATDSTGAIRTARTNGFGHYRFTGLQTGETYTVTVRSKGFAFNPASRVVTLAENATDIDFEAVPERTR